VPGAESAAVSAAVWTYSLLEFCFFERVFRTRRALKGYLPVASNALLIFFLYRFFPEPYIKDYNIDILAMWIIMLSLLIKYFLTGKMCLYEYHNLLVPAIHLTVFHNFSVKD
jgi:hypothetical protein